MSSRLWLLLPALILYSIDVTMTLAGQPAEYWAGDYERVIEYNPIARALLVYHPGLFAGAAVAWALVVAAFVLWVRHPLARWVAILLTVGCAVGGSSWLVRTGSTGWLFAAVYLVVASWLTGVCWRRSQAGAVSRA